MSTSIYYFSATGNSLTCAQMLADLMDDCRLIPAASFGSDRKIIEDADQVGFVFPVYYGDMPYPVRNLIERMVFKPDSYIFILTTYRGHAGDVAGRMDQLLKSRGQRLSMALGVPMPGNSFINEPQVDAEHLKKQKERLQEQAEMIFRRETNNYATKDVLKLTPVAWPNNFRGITADDRCIGCGRCAKVCPMDNIRLVDDHAIIGDDCATCLSCFHWCPTEAIWMSLQENIARRSKYHHPDVSFSDIVSQKMFDPLK